ncbi:MAG TPA: hypothetical protein V6D23_26165, partial [Candidatus Obscuribacterales bacterium]
MSAGSGHTDRPVPSAAPTSAPSAWPTAEATPSAMASGSPMPSATATSDISIAERPIAEPDTSPSAAPSATPASISPDQARAGLLTAGTWRDLDHWDFWLGLMQKQEWSKMLQYWGISPIHRLSVKAMQGERPAVDQALLLKDAQGETIARARSDNRGQADFFPSLFKSRQGPFSIESEDGSASLSELQPSAQTRELQFAGTAAAPNAVDLMLMVDTTGS